MQTALLNSILRQQNVAGGLASIELPEDMEFPLVTSGQVDAVEEKLTDAATKKVLVRVVMKEGFMHMLAASS